MNEDGDRLGAKEANYFASCSFIAKRRVFIKFEERVGKRSNPDNYILLKSDLKCFDTGF